MQNLSTNRLARIIRLFGLALVVVGMGVIGLLSLAIAIGFCLHWVVPTVELGIACTIASITLATVVCCSTFLVVGFAVTAARLEGMEEEADEESEEETARTIEAISELVFQKMQDSLVHESKAQARQSKKRIYR